MNIENVKNIYKVKKQIEYFQRIVSITRIL